VPSGPERQKTLRDCLVQEISLSFPSLIFTNEPG
jgi:hypothetical protein